MACVELRDVLRANLASSRQTNRDEILKFKRKALQDSIDVDRVINSSEVSLVANKLKSKSLIQIEDLALLKLALVQSSDNTITFLKVKGALHGLIRELSSGTSKYQLTAAECCCNLALGDVKSCLQIAKAAGPYLISMLSGSNYNMINVSVWTLGNLVGSGEKVWRVVHSQGFLPKLLNLLCEYDSTQHDLQVQSDILHNSLGAMVQLLRVGVNLLTTEEVESIVSLVSTAKHASAKGLKTCEYLLSCMDSAEKTLLENQVHLKSLEFLSETILNEETVASLTAAVRTVANLVAESTGNCAMQVFQVWKTLENFTGKIFSLLYTHLKMEIQWLLGNLVNHPSPQVQAALLHDSSLEFRIFISTVCSS